ncbi:MAG: DEAD/DEAH box helicase [Betaproteobacteria bacterium]|nr:DEAD/DEAH box helicase [Betaproteobacteria bacterium]
MTEIVTIASSAVNAKLHEPSRQAKLEVQRILSYRVEGAEHSSAFKSGNWDGRSSFLDFRSGVFPAGFVHFVGANLRRKGYEVRFVTKPAPIPLGPENPRVGSFPEDPRYDYQMEVVRRLVKHKQIIAQVATGGGKSLVARLAFARINRPTLFLTTRGILMYQMKEAFERDLGVPCSVLGDGQFGHVNAAGQQAVKKMCVGMVQTLMSRLEETTVEREFEKLYDFADKKRASKADAEKMKAAAERKCAEQNAVRQQTISLLAKFEFVILEEAHEASGNSYFEILRHCKNAHYRLALTGTPFMKDDEEANMRLMASSGPIAIKVTEKMLIDREILAKPYFKVIDLKKKPLKLLRGTGWQSAYRIGIVDNEERNQAIVAEVARAARYGLSSMVLIQQKKHGEILQNLLKAKGLAVEFIQGENDQTERKRALNKLATGKIDALIGTTILDVGVDVPAVGLIILAGGGKAEVALRQRIGRGLRAKKNGPNVALIVDFTDPFNNHTKSHAMQRYRIILETEGFGENVVRDDFDFEALGFERKAA